MKSRLSVACVLILVGFMALAVGCSKEKAASDEASETLAAQVGDWTLTRAELDELIAQLPEHQKQKYDSP